MIKTVWVDCSSEVDGMLKTVRVVCSSGVDGRLGIVDSSFFDVKSNVLSSNLLYVNNEY